MSTLLKRLSAVGIRGELQANRLAFRLSEPEGTTLSLASPIAHPWLRDHTLTQLGVYENMPAYQALVAANTRLKHILSSGAPASLRQQAQAQLALRVREYCAALLPAVQFNARVQFSGHAVLAPGTQLHLDQVGLAEDLAWSLFGPLMRRELSSEEVQSRSERATSLLDELMTRTWVIIHHAPAFTPQTFLAFHPVRHREPVIRLHPLACRLLQADFDGDQAAIFLPLTDEGQQEAGERLSVAGHLTRTPHVLHDLVPNNEALWGLASLSLTEAGKEEITEMLGMPDIVTDKILTRTMLEEALQLVLQQDGVSRTLERLEQLVQRGFTISMMSGASISPFIGSHCTLPTAPANNESKEWALYQQEVSEWLATNIDYTNPDLGPQLLAVKSGAWGEIEHLTSLLSTQGVARDIHSRQVPIRHGYREGLLPAEIYALAIGAREAFAQIQKTWQQITQEIRQRDRATSFHGLARVMRAEQPAIVLAHAASIEEIDPLTDRDSRLFVGLPAD